MRCAQPLCWMTSAAPETKLYRTSKNREKTVAGGFEEPSVVLAYAWARYKVRSIRLHSDREFLPRDLHAGA